MSGLDNLKARLNFNGGANQEQRMNLDKLRSLRKALLYSYQAQTAILSDEREFRCLINHDKLKEDYDDKIISIPYRDICLNADKKGKKTEDGMEDIGMKVGDVFTWKETNTKWIVIQEILEENAYFRGTIRKAEDEIVIDGKSYYGYLGKWSKDALWHTKGLNSWSEMGYEVVLYITRDETTENYFHRFKKITINDRLWEVQMVNDITSATMLIIYLKETFINEFGDQEENTQDDINNNVITSDVYIEGKDSLYPFDISTYNIVGANGGQWFISNNNAVINSQSEEKVEIQITSTKTGNIILIYRRNNEDDIIKEVIIKSL